MILTTPAFFCSDMSLCATRPTEKRDAFRDHHPDLPRDLLTMPKLREDLSTD